MAATALVCPMRPRNWWSPVDAFLITDILRDNEARTPSFGAELAAAIGSTGRVKTGTTNDFRDNLTVGYTPQLVTGVWVGNADNSPMRNISGVSGAGPNLESDPDDRVGRRTSCRLFAAARRAVGRSLPPTPATPIRTLSRWRRSKRF